MGYSTDYHGRFDLDKPLTEEQAAYLVAFSETRRMRRDATLAATKPDPIREAVGLPVGKEGAYFVGGDGFMGQDSTNDVLNSNNPPTEQPGLWCQWVPTEDRKGIEWDGNEKFYYAESWLEYIMNHFLNIWGLTLTGQVAYQGEEDSDFGTIQVDGLYARRIEADVVYEEECEY